MSASRNHDVIALLLGLVTLAADQLTKLWIVQYFGAEGMRPPIPIIGNVLTLYYVQNTGVAFSLFAGQNVKFLLIALAFGLICFLYWHYRNTAPLWLRLGFALVLGGAVGNLLDRFTRSFVVDFIHFQLGAFNFAVFNVADSAITVGVILIALCIYRMGGVSESISQPVESKGAQEVSERR
ncbi:MAG TPA: signal peptidase II [Ktedonobacterales bacterium]|nr:signal peptidase II [Ktedonobacterales bacterium]